MKRTLIAFLTLTLTAAAFAAPPPGRPGRGPQGTERGGPRGQMLPPALVAEFLGLTDAQITQFESLREQQQATIKPLVEQQRANRQAIEEALAAGNSARAGELMLANYNLRAQIKAAHESFKASFDALLTAEQKAKWAVYQELMELRKQRRN